MAQSLAEDVMGAGLVSLPTGDILSITDLQVDVEALHTELCLKAERVQLLRHSQRPLTGTDTARFTELCPALTSSQHMECGAMQHSTAFYFLLEMLSSWTVKQYVGHSVSGSL